MEQEIDSIDSKNKLYTKSYFIKRLIDAKIHLKKDWLVAYPKNDPRKWTIMIDHNDANILCTCYKQLDPYVTFRFISKHGHTSVSTFSMVVVIDHIKQTLLS
jgi:hypothetical protein